MARACRLLASLRGFVARVLGWRPSRGQMRILCYVVLPFVAGVGSLAAIVFCVLKTHEAPQPAGIQFDVDASPALGQAAGEITFRHVAREAGAVPLLLASTGTDLVVSADGCAQEVHVSLGVYPDPRWWLILRAGRQKRFQRLAIQRGRVPVVSSLKPGTVRGVVAATIPGQINDAKAYVRAGDPIPLPLRQSVSFGAEGAVTRLVAHIPGRALRGVLLRPTLGQSIAFTFGAPWVTGRGFKSCMVNMPALVAGQVPSWPPLGASGLTIASGTMLAAAGPENGTSRLIVSNGSIDHSETEPSPYTSTAPVWYCHRDAKPSGPPPSDCHALVVIEEPNRETEQQLLLIVLGAVGTAGLLGFANGLRRFLVPWNANE